MGVTVIRRLGEVSIGLGVAVLLLGLSTLGPASDWQLATRQSAVPSPDLGLGYPIVALASCCFGGWAIVRSVRGVRRAWLAGLAAVVADASATVYVAYLVAATQLVLDSGGSNLMEMEALGSIYTGVPAFFLLMLGSLLLWTADAFKRVR
jgi:hypothetical protein